MSKFMLLIMVLLFGGVACSPLQQAINTAGTVGVEFDVTVKPVEEGAAEAETQVEETAVEPTEEGTETLEADFADCVVGEVCQAALDAAAALEAEAAEQAAAEAEAAEQAAAEAEAAEQAAAEAEAQDDAGDLDFVYVSNSALTSNDWEIIQETITDMSVVKFIDSLAEIPMFEGRVNVHVSDWELDYDWVLHRGNHTWADLQAMVPESNSGYFIVWDAPESAPLNDGDLIVYVSSAALESNSWKDLEPTIGDDTKVEIVDNLANIPMFEGRRKAYVTGWELDGTWVLQRGNKLWTDLQAMIPETGSNIFIVWSQPDHYN